ncbi:hypothetical protein, partial [Pseudomonas syringae group genomosp. 7]|uniref:hypothetical protein n=1 Tax=Pseudomonas syringae group genomosp. 7 TaxID=251699 RepID=UPI00376F915E
VGWVFGVVGVVCWCWGVLWVWGGLLGCGVVGCLVLGGGWWCWCWVWVVWCGCWWGWCGGCGWCGLGVEVGCCVGGFGGGVGLVLLWWWVFVWFWVCWCWCCWLCFGCVFVGFGGFVAMGGWVCLFCVWGGGFWGGLGRWCFLWWGFGVCFWVALWLRARLVLLKYVDTFVQYRESME